MQAIWVALLFAVLTVTSSLHAQNERGNISLISTGSSAGASEGDALQRDLLPLVMTSSSGSGVEVAQQPFQVGVIAVRPSYIDLLSKQLSPLYLRPSDMIGTTFSTSNSYRYGTTALAQPLSVDPDDMELDTLTWFTFHGINFNKPRIKLGTEFDTNSSNTSVKNTEPTIAQNSSIRIPFTYGTIPGDSAFLMRLEYEPTHRMILSGPGGNEVNHDVIFQAGKDLGRFAFALNNTTTLSSFPIRELSGRNRVFSNITSIRTAYDIAPRSFILSELRHSFSTRTTSNTSTQSANTPSQSIIVDDIQFNYNYLVTPKLFIIPDLTISRSSLVNSVVWTKSGGVRLTYLPTTKLIFTGLGGIQIRDSNDSPEEFSKLYGLEIDYILRQKTVMELDLLSEIRPSFAEEGIFLREDSIKFGIQQALLLRWLLELQLEYTLRKQDSSTRIASVEQDDIGVEFTLGYMLTDLSYLELSINRYQLKDKRTGAINNRLNLQLTYQRAF